MVLLLLYFDRLHDGEAHQVIVYRDAFCLRGDRVEGLVVSLSPFVTDCEGPQAFGLCVCLHLRYEVFVLC